MKRILAIDPGAKCGLAYCNNSSEIMSRGVSLDGEWPDRMYEFWLSMHNIVSASAGDYLPDIVAIERIAAPGAKRPNVIKLHRYIGVAALFASSVNAELVEVATQSWKSALGLPQATPPDQYTKAVQTIMGIKSATDDEAAALGILNWAMTRHGG